MPVNYPASLAAFDPKSRDKIAELRQAAHEYKPDAAALDARLAAGAGGSNDGHRR